MIHTFTLAIKVDYSRTDYKYFHQQINALKPLKLIDENHYKSMLIVNNKLTSTLTPEEIDNMPVVMFEHIEHCKNGKQTCAWSRLFIESKYLFRNAVTERTIYTRRTDESKFSISLFNRTGVERSKDFSIF